MLGLTTVGLIHTILSVVALGAGVTTLVRHREILWSNRSGQTYLAATTLTALTAFAIFRHGGFGPGHVIAALTLIAVTAGSIVGRNARAGSWSRAFQAVAFSATILFHLIPGTSETLTRIPLEAPYADAPDSPVLRPFFLGYLVIFVVLAVIQVRRIRRTMLPSDI